MELEKRTCNGCGETHAEDVMFICGSCGGDFCSPCKDSHRCTVKGFNRGAFFKWRDDMKRKSEISLHFARVMEKRVDDLGKMIDDFNRKYRETIRRNANDL